jgi:Holliday junction resolvase
MTDKAKQGQANCRSGSRAEHRVVALFEDAGFKAERVPLSGQNGRTLFNADVHVEIDRRNRKIEVKKRSGGAGFKTITDWLAGADMLVLLANRQTPLVVLPLGDLIEMMKAARGATSPAGSGGDADAPDDLMGEDEE